MSVVIRTYQRAPMLAEALESVLAQTAPPGEIVVVDDASTDDTVEVVARYTTGAVPVRLVRFEENRGMDRAKEAGVEAAEGPWIALLDSDDLWRPRHLEATVAALDAHPHEPRFAFTRYGLVDVARRQLVEVVAEPMLGEEPYRAFLRKELVVHPSRSLFRKDTIEAIGGVPLCGPVGDWVMNVLSSFQFPDGVVQVPVATIDMRIHGDQSYNRPTEMRDRLLQGTDYILDRLPLPSEVRAEIRSINLLDSAVFIWQAGLWGEAWRSLGRAVSSDRRIVRSRRFPTTVGRLLLPPAVGRRGRSWKRRAQRSRSRV